MLCLLTSRPSRGQEETLIKSSYGTLGPSSRRRWNRDRDEVITCAAAVGGLTFIPVPRGFRCLFSWTTTYMYDKTPVYAHHADLFWAHEPFKTIYVLQRVLTTMLLVPCWVIYYGILPRRFRPRASWSIKQIIVVKFMKRVSRVVEVAGVTWGTRDPTVAPEEGSLKETRFTWVPALPEELRTGIVDDDQVQCMPIGTYIWPKEPHPSIRMRKDSKDASPPPSSAENKPNSMADDLENAAADAPPRMIGIYLHGGGYCHYSAHESSGTSRVPRRLVKDGLFQEVHGQSC